MFLNFELHPNTRRFAGVDLRPLELDKEETSLNWRKNLMGFWSSPYDCIKICLIIEEVIQGDHGDPTNLFQWSHIHLNLVCR